MEQKNGKGLLYVQLGVASNVWASSDIDAFSLFVPSFTHMVEPLQTFFCRMSCSVLVSLSSASCP
jgi:hypothetical protein